MRSWTVFTVLALLGIGCTAETNPEVRAAEAISVTVELPSEWRGFLLAPANGRVLDGDGSEVAHFVFEAAWENVSPWAQEEAVKTGAPTEVVVELPTSGTFTFELSDVGISGNPCGTCGVGFAETSTVVEVDDGSVVELPVGEPTWIS